MDMATDINVSDAREKLSALIDQATSGQVPVYLARRGRRVAAIVDSDVLARLLELAEDMEDILAAEESRREMAELAETPIPWDEVKAELAL
ncbi:MAG: type II toxin-antitoxin system Phd/YefM family antitoxin [Jatrophihabitantaceae bacterium]